MRLLLLVCSLLTLNVACNTPQQEYSEQRSEAREEYVEEIKEADKDFTEAQKEEAIDYVEESDEARAIKDEGKVDVKE